MPRFVQPLTLAIFAIFFANSSLSGQGQVPDPNSPSSRGVEQLREFLQSTGGDSIDSFISDHGAKELFEKHGQKALHNLLRSTRTAFLGAIFAGARPSGAFSVLMMFEGISDTIPNSVGFRLEEVPPYRSVETGFVVDAAHALSKPASDADIVRFLEQYVNDLAAKDEFSGTVLLAKNGRPIFEGAFGQACKQYGVSNNIDTKINLGSMNKMFTGVAICQLVEQGKLSFDDTIAECLPDYPNAEVARQVTIHQLLTHTSGMGSYWNDEYESRWKTIRAVEDLLPTFVNDPLLFVPGEQFGYSNAGPVVLGLIIEKTTGLDYYEYVRKNIYEPAGMQNTGCFEMDRPVENLAIGYTNMDYQGRRIDGPRRNNLFMHSIKGGPAGGGFSTVGDLLRFSVALQSNKLLQPETQRVMLEGKVPMGQGFYYAYLFGQHGEGKLRNYGHNGGAPGISADFRFYPELGYTAAVLSNYDDVASSVAMKIESLIRQKAIGENPSLQSSQPEFKVGIAFGRSPDGVMIREVIEGGAAEKAGLMANDLINKINGNELGTQWMDLLAEPLRNGSPIKFEIVRKGKTLTIDVTPSRQ